MSIRPSFVIGNGESRQGIDLDCCKNLGLTVGCNAIVRDFVPHAVSAADQRMVKEIKEHDFEGKIYTRPDWNVKFLVDEYPALPYESTKREDDAWHWNSGPHAINITCSSKHPGWFGKTTNLCFLLGFDLNQNAQCNNIYKNTHGYDNKVIDAKLWHHQIEKMFECYPQVTFVWVAPNAYTCPEQWSMHENFFRETVVDFNQFVKDFDADKKLPNQFIA